MGRGTVRFWAAARAAAGTAEETYDAATLADALAQCRAQHGPALARVLDRSSFLVDGAPVGVRAHDSVPLPDDWTVEVLPPFAGGAEPAVATAPPRADRLSVTVAGLGAGAVAAALAGLSLAGIGGIAAGVFAVQVVAALAWLAAIEARGGGGAFVICVGTSAVIDALLGAESQPDIGRAAGPLGVAVVVSLLFQLARRPRVEVAQSFAGTLAGLAVALAAASYVALHVEPGGGSADVAALVGAGAALAIARLADLVLPHPAAAPGSRRGVVGCVAGVAAAAAVGWAYGRHAHVLGASVGLRIAAITAVIAIVADLAVDAVLVAAPPPDERARSALPPLGILLPVALSAPAAYVVGRLLLG